MYKQVTGAHLTPYLTSPTSPLKKQATITPEEHSLSKEIDQVDLPSIASSDLLQSEEEPKSIKRCVKSKDSIFSNKCSSQILQHHTSIHQLYGSTGIANSNGELEAEYKSREKQLSLQQCCKSEESVASDKSKQCNSLNENTEKNSQHNAIVSFCTCKRGCGSARSCSCKASHIPCSSACHSSITSCSNFPTVKKLEVVELSEKSQNTWFNCCGITLFKSDEIDILEGKWLTDNIIIKGF